LAFHELRDAFPGEAADLIEDISRKAAAVFRWVSVVTNKLVADFVEGRYTSLAEARSVINELPDSMLALFSKIWKDIDRKDKPIWSMLMRLTLAAYVPLEVQTLWHFGNGQYPPLADNLQHVESRVSLSRLVKRRLDTYTKDLLEVDSKQCVGLLHRIVKEWADSPKTQPELRDGSPSDFDPYLSLLEAGVSGVPMIEFPEPDRPVPGSIRLRHAHSVQFIFWEPIARNLSYASEIEDSSKFSDRLISALDRLDVAATNLANAHKEVLPCSKDPGPRDRHLHTSTPARHGACRPDTAHTAAAQDCSHDRHGD